MKTKAIGVLEFDKVRSMLAEECVSYMGQELARALVPMYDALNVEAAQQETAEATDYLNRSGASPIHGFNDTRAELERARLGAILQPGELLRLASTLHASRSLRESLLKGNTIAGDKLQALAGQLISLSWYENDVERCIQNDERVADAASGELAAIRRKMFACHARIKQRLEAVIRSPKYRDVLMDAIITLRGGRYVVPVKQEYRSRLPGLVHDQSSSGATLFIEPMEAVEANNELRELEVQETEEIQRILAALSAAIAPYYKEVNWALEAMAQLDFAFAKARLAYKMNAVPPILSKNNVLSITRGRHPLLDPLQVVPISLKIGAGFNTLLITGPNTGGKTVTLKTAGLFAMMAQAGLCIPAEEACLPVFEGVYADIGDEQSIEQNLSTFSSHMRNIVSILEEAGEKTLVLLDELGAGTDPHEGAALAIAIIERLKRRHCTTMATTHYSELKAYALTTEGVENASMEFDLETLRPTYRLTMGIPGKSNAFEIALRLGISQDVIEFAREQMSKEITTFEDVLKSAEYHKEVAKKEREEAEALNKEIQVLHRRADMEREKLRAQQENILNKAHQEAQAVLDKAKRESERIISELKNMKTLRNSSDIDRGIQQARDQLRQSERAIVPESERIPQGEIPKDLKAGETVILNDSELAAIVISPPDAKGDVVVQAGIMKLTTKIGNLRRGQGKKDKEIKKRAPHFNLSTVSRELDIRGMNGEEGLMEVDRYLDEAFRSGLTEVNIIHGKGTGKLREIIQSFLGHHPHVRRFRTGQFGEGESGVTVVTLK